MCRCRTCLHCQRRGFRRRGRRARAVLRWPCRPLESDTSAPAHTSAPSANGSRGRRTSVTLVTVTGRSSRSCASPLRGGALARPRRRVVELVRDLRGPVAAEVAVEEIALDRLAESRRAARAIDFPARRENRRAAERDVRPGRLLRRPLLRATTSAFRLRSPRRRASARSARSPHHSPGLLVNWLEVLHSRLELPEKPGLASAISP